MNEIKSRDAGSVTFVQALKDKYVDQDELDDRFRLPKDKSITTEITFVGFGSVASVQKHLRRLVSIDLSSRQIKTAGDLSEIAGSLDRVSIINLSDNFLTWQEVIRIISCLPNLREIILSANDLKVDQAITFPREPHKKLISLTLGRINQTWSDIVSVVSKIWTSIEQIDLWDNKLVNESLRLHRDNLFVSQLVSLKLSRNFLQDLTWVIHIGKLDRLIELDVSNCQLKSISLDPSMVIQLKNLSLLNISYNNITEWLSLSTLDLLPALVKLICNDNPIFSSSNSRALTVARISRLKNLNREEITPAFRRDSEILYLRSTYNECLKDKCKDFDRQHPRYAELVEIYGLPEDLNVKQKVDKYITVDLCLDDASITKKLPCDMRISNLHMLCKRLFKLKPSVNIEIVYCEAQPTEGSISYLLDKDGQTLHFFSVKNNHKLLIKQK